MNIPLILLKKPQLGLDMSCRLIKNVYRMMNFYSRMRAQLFQCLLQMQVSPQVLPPEGGIKLPQELSEGGVNEAPASVSEDVPSNQEPKSHY
jgi:hypothetical protein